MFRSGPRHSPKSSPPGAELQSLALGWEDTKRLKANTAKAMGYSQTLSTLAERDPEAAEKFASDPNKAVYLMFHGDLTEMSKDLKELDAETERMKLVADVSPEERRSTLKDMKDTRNEILKSADALNDQLIDARLQMRKAQ